MAAAGEHRSGWNVQPSLAQGLHAGPCCWPAPETAWKWLSPERAAWARWQARALTETGSTAAYLLILQLISRTGPIQLQRVQ